MNSIEQLGITPFESIGEVFALSDPITEPALRASDIQLARSAFTAVARILEKTGHISTPLAESFILESEQRIANLE
jgi:hypothetical protein